ncbi:MAG: hypothetical protein ABI528_01475 [bacterium]
MLIAAFVFYSCEKESDAIIDPSISAPIITNQFQSKDTVFTTSANPLINLIASVTVNTNGGSAITNVVCSVISPDGNTIGQFNMLDNGTGGDTNASDSRYTAAINISNIQCLIVGNYGLEFLAENSSTLFSNLITSSLKVVNPANVPPVITATNLPDSVIRPAVTTDSTLLTISIDVNDADGLCDLKEVIFVTTRPNGVLLPPIPMTYSGNGRFVFSNYVLFSSNPTSFGYFKYEFTARDNSNLFSVPVTDSIKFVMPINP